MMFALDDPALLPVANYLRANRTRFEVQMPCMTFLRLLPVNLLMQVAAYEADEASTKTAIFLTLYLLGLWEPLLPRVIEDDHLHDAVLILRDGAIHELERRSGGAS